MTDFLVSVVIPVFNEEKNVSPLLEHLSSVLKDNRYEIIFVDDGSRDDTPEIIKKHAHSDHKIKLISFYRNFGHMMALTCGYQHAKGDAVISMDADMQDPPEIIPQMIQKWKNGAKIVYAKREEREVDSAFKKFTARMFYKFINFLSDTPIPNDVGDYRLLDKKVIKFLNELPEQSRFLRGLVAWSGYPAEFVHFKREKRLAGETHYTLSRMVNFALDGMTSFSTKPLRISSYLGFIAGSLGFIGIIYAIVGRIFLPKYWVTGWAALFVGIMFLGGVQLITIGIIGEYIAKIYKEVQRRPPYLIKEVVNV